MKKHSTYSTNKPKNKSLLKIQKIYSNKYLKNPKLNKVKYKLNLSPKQS